MALAGLSALVAVGGQENSSATGGKYHKYYMGVYCIDTAFIKKKNINKKNLLINLYCICIRTRQGIYGQI